ncbi:MAG: hypothetical protein ACNA8P_05095 [Phycisphaerales bacterium]
MRATVYNRFVRIGRLYLGLLIVFVLAINLPLGSGRLLGMGGAVLWGVLTVALVMPISGVFVLLPMRRRLNRAMNSSEELPCPWCLYDLSRSPEAGLCPECSAVYSHDGVRAYWVGVKNLFQRAKRAGVFRGDRALLRESGLE